MRERSGKFRVILVNIDKIRADNFHVFLSKSSDFGSDQRRNFSLKISVQIALLPTLKGEISPLREDRTC
jgi:hypothetical protein